MLRTEYPFGEIARLGRKIYDEQLRSRLEPEHNDKFVVINVETGEYEMDEDHLAASNRADARWPLAPLSAVRVGHEAVGRLGARVRLAGR